VADARILEFDPDLGAGLDAAAFAVARTRVVAPVVELGEGEAPLQRYTPEHRLRGLLVLEGMIARELRVAGRGAIELLGPGDVLRPWEQNDLIELHCTVTWRVLAPTTLALLDRAFVERTRTWPQLADALLGRAVRRAHSLLIHRAVIAQKRLDVRILMLFWHLADRWGRTQGDGSVRLRLPLTHKAVGLVAGAERPSVSTALGRLAAEGLVTHEHGEWILSRSAVDHIEFVMATMDEGQAPVSIAEN
jgi:CRP-like cAMP-binding protein